MHDVSGVSGAAPVWREVMDWLHRGDAAQGRPKQASSPPGAPAGLIRSAIRFEPPREPPRQEWFISGTEMPVIRAASADALARIAYPAAGSIIALDPDIPPNRQRVALRLSAPAGLGWVWRMDKILLGNANIKTHWLPQPGRHRLTLEDGQGKTLDAVVLEVRSLKGRARQGDLSGTRKGVN
jgi:penicillin-binding protein 1C